MPFASATVIAVCAFATFSGFLFLNALYLQEVRGLAAFTTGLCTLPIALAMSVCAPISGRLIGRFGARPPLMIGGAATALSAVMLVGVEADTPLPWLIGAYTVFGVGFGLVNPPITNTAVSGMPRAQAGVAAAVASTSRQVGASMGVAIGGTLRRLEPAPAIAASSHAGFVTATHAFWWLVVAAGLIVIALGRLATGAYARASVARIAALLDG